MYLSGHPLDGVRWMGQLLHVCTLQVLVKAPDQANVKALCVVQSVKRHTTKKGEDMAFITLEDMTGTMDGIVFPKLCTASVGRLRKDALVYVTGRISRKEEGASVICESIRTFEELPMLLRQMQLCIKIQSPADTAAFAKLTALCRQYPGETRVILYHTASGSYTSPRIPLYAEICESFFNALTDLFLPEQLGLIAPVGRN